MVGESSGGEPGGCGSLFGVCVCGWAFVRWVVLMLVLSAQSQGCNLVVAGRCVYACGWGPHSTLCCLWGLAWSSPWLNVLLGGARVVVYSLLLQPLRMLLCGVWCPIAFFGPSSPAYFGHSVVHWCVRSPVASVLSQPFCCGCGLGFPFQLPS